MQTAYLQFLTDLLRQNPIAFVVAALFCASFIVQLFYYLFFYLRTPACKSKQSTTEQPPVSVVICAKNESKNLQQFLPMVLEQEYPDFQVIVVDDGSGDDTGYLLAELKQQYPNLYVTGIPQDAKFGHGKKLAVTIGVKAAKHEWLLFTDADCTPIGKNWIATMAQHFSEQNNIVLGYSGYRKERGLLNKLIRYDAFFIGVQYLSFALAKTPYMGVGRNMAYRKSFFFKNKGFSSHYHLPSGDDDLFVNQNAKKSSTRTECSPEGQTKSVPEQTLKDWLKQKSRHISTARYYKKRHRILLFLEPLSRLLFYVAFFALLSFNFYIQAVLAVFAFRFVAQFLILHFSGKRLKEPGLAPLAFLFDILLPLVGIYLLTAKPFYRKKTRWKI